MHSRKSIMCTTGDADNMVQIRRIHSMSRVWFGIRPFKRIRMVEYCSECHCSTGNWQVIEVDCKGRATRAVCFGCSFTYWILGSLLEW